MRATTIITLPACIDEWATARKLKAVRSIYTACPTADHKLRVEYNGKRYSNADLFRILQGQKVYRTIEPEDLEEIEEFELSENLDYE